ncbi:restriction endonuclease subunit S [Methylobacterium sp. Leaf91]|uniref:restriction endonuclease subunit S n=1 Tax=Methylobacterium sp. Leaf91 TaxID=1736247 RepID=UPI0009E78BCC|nr:restriction endonuclease subunit S [Methylobacterium sp. Leaf91]
MKVPQDWRECRLEDLLAPELGALTDGPFGSSLKSEHYAAEGGRVIRLNNIGRGQFNDADKVYIDMDRFSRLRRHEARAGDLVTAALGEPLGRTCLVPESIGPALVKADCFRTRLARQVDARLICFWLNSPALSRHFNEKSKGVGRIRINSRTLREAPLPLPPRTRQREIANHLGRVEARAEVAKVEAGKAVKAVEALRLSGLRAGVSGELTIRRRAGVGFGESVEELLARVPVPVQGAVDQSTTDVTMRGLGVIAVNDPSTPIPASWRWTPLLRVAALGTGHTPSRRRPEYWGGDVPWLSIPDARDNHGGVVRDTSQKTTPEGIANSSARLLPAGTVCLSRTASVGYVTILGVPMATSQDFVTWTCSEALVPEYLMFALMAEGRGIRRFGRGSTHTTIYMPELRAFQIALPPLQEQKEIASLVSRILLRAGMMLRAATDAVRAADQLLPRAIAHAMAGGLDKVARSEESANVLLDEIKRDRDLIPVIKRRRRTSAIDDRRINEDMVTSDAQPEHSQVGNPDLIEVLRSSGGEMPATELWRRSGLQIDRFYRSLREAVDAGLIAESEDKEVLRAG